MKRLLLILIVAFLVVTAIAVSDSFGNEPEATPLQHGSTVDGAALGGVLKDAQNYRVLVYVAATERAKLVAWYDAAWADYIDSLPRSSGGGGCTEASIIERESGGDPTVYNTQGSGASGTYQFLPSTWDGYGGYANAADAPPEVQRERFLEVWNGGAGASHWSC